MTKGWRLNVELMERRERLRRERLERRMQRLKLEQEIAIMVREADSVRKLVESMEPPKVLGIRLW